MLMIKVTAILLFPRMAKIVLLVCLALNLSACLGTVVGAVVDTTIEIVKVPFKVGGAVIDVATGDDFTDQRLNAESAKSAKSVEPSFAPIADEQVGLQ